jgi:hypothetical protein
MKARLTILWIAFLLVFSVAVVLFVYRVAGLPLWFALLFPVLMYLVGGLLNVIGTLWARRTAERRDGQKGRHL